MQVINNVLNFNKKHRPNKIILVRHGESEGNTNPK